MTQVDVAPVRVLKRRGGHRPYTVSPVVDVRVNGPTTVLAPAPPPRTAIMIAIVGAGIFLDGLADALARTGRTGPVLPLFFLGLLAIFLPCAWRLTSAHASRNQRVGAALVLGVGLLVSYVLRSPLIFDSFDELIHGANLSRMLDNHTLLVPNTLLPVSTYYPGLELLTSAVKLVTGLPLVLSQVVVLLVARVVLTLCVFLVVERVCGSARAGGIGVLVYAANPEFYAFDAGYAYETLALAFAAAAVYLIIASIDEAGRRRSGRRALSLAESMGQLMVPRSELLFAAPAVLGPMGSSTTPKTGAEPSGPMERAQALRMARDLGLAMVCIGALDCDPPPHLLADGRLPGGRGGHVAPERSAGGGPCGDRIGGRRRRGCHDMDRHRGSSARGVPGTDLRWRRVGHLGCAGPGARGPPALQ